MRIIVKNENSTKFKTVIKKIPIKRKTEVFREQFPRWRHFVLKVDSNKEVKNEMTLIRVKFGVDLISTFKVTNRTTKCMSPFFSRTQNGVVFAVVYSCYIRFLTSDCSIVHSFVR